MSWGRLYATSPHTNTKFYHRVQDVELRPIPDLRVIKYKCGGQSTLAKVFTRAYQARTVLGNRRPCPHCVEEDD